VHHFNYGQWRIATGRGGGQALKTIVS